MSPTTIDLVRQAKAIAALRPLFVTPKIEVLSRHPDGTVALRFLARTAPMPISCSSCPRCCPEILRYAFATSGPGTPPPALMSTGDRTRKAR